MKKSRLVWVGVTLVLLCALAGVWYWRQGPGEAAAEPDALRNDDGSWKYTNRLAGESSPYLLLHAHNPVDWYPWGEEALERARREDRPIFLSVGYSTCYWCHVMERQVFSNPKIAALMNQWFVSIKVDREERPDLDRIYMVATQLLTRGGGWPNSVFLTPELQPFFAGTYFPPERFKGVLNTMHEVWTQRRAEVEQSAAELSAAIRQYEAGRQVPPADPDTALVGRALADIEAHYDAAHGGFGGAPKFPPSMRLEFLLDQWERRGDERALEIVRQTLDQMARGGIYDQVGGGFHRYSTDAQWRVPHFEKMLYNQAQLAHIYLRAYAATGTARWRRMAMDILRFVGREMTGPEGGFYSALDAETGAVEGLYYLWTEEEIRRVLGEEAGIFFAVYALAPGGEGGVVYQKHTFQEAAGTLGVEVPRLQAQIERLRAHLLQARARRQYPLLDDKVVTAWNGLMIGAYARACAVLHDTSYCATAARAADFVLEHLRSPSGALQRVYRRGSVKYDAYLEDYAYLAHGLLELYRAGGEKRWLERGRVLAAAMRARFWDEENKGFFFTEGGGDLLVRSKSGQDSALPAGNAVAAHTLLELAHWSGEEEYRTQARELLRAFGGAMQASPGGFTHLIAAAARLLAEEGAAGRPALPRMDSLPALPDTLVRAAAELEPARPTAGEPFVLKVHLEIAPGWHINAHPASGKTLIPTSLTLNADLPVEMGEVRYPRGEPLYFAATGDTLMVYQGKVLLEAPLRPRPEAAGRRGDLHLLVQYQACDDSRCLPPEELLQAVGLEVAD